MKHSRLTIFAVLVSVLLLLSASSLPALAAKPAAFSANGAVTSITDGTVKPAGASGRFVVMQRELNGTFAGPDLTGDFTMAYKANVELATQAGDIHGTMTMKDSGRVLNLNGTIQPLEMVPVPLAPGFVVDLPKLTISGHWNFASGGQAQGDFTAWVVFVPDANGHIVFIPASAFTLTGQS